MGYSHGELTNYANIARDCGIEAKTVKEYYQILVDTLLGTMLEPYRKREDLNATNALHGCMRISVFCRGVIS